MSASLYQLVYCSHNAIPEGNVSLTDEVRQILTVAQRNNSLVGVTGALLFTPTGFAQVLEGPKEAIEATFERIQMDMRHCDITVLSFDLATQRSFPNWSMAMVGDALPVDMDILRELVPRSTDLQTLSASGHQVLSLLENIVLHEDGHINL